MRNLKIKLIEIWTLALIIIVSILFISNPSRVSASTATPLATPPATPTVSWSGTGNYQRIAGADSNDYSLSGMSSTINTDYGQANFDSSTATALGSKVKASTRLMVCNYVGFKSEITIPAKTKYTVVYNAAMYMNQLCSGNGSGYGWMVFYHMGDTDLSSSITFKWNNAGTYPSGVSAYLLNVYRRGTNSATRQITKTYENNTTTDKTFTEYFGLNTSDDYGSSYYYRHTDTVTMSSTVTFEGFVGPTKPTAQTSSKVYNGELQDFVLDNIDVNCLTKVEFSVGGNTETLFSVDPQDPTTQVGNSHIINGALRVKETGTYHLTFSLPASELWWSDGSTGDYDLSVEITPKPLQMSWATQRYDNGESGADNFFFMLPTPNVTLDMQNLLNDVKYYKFSDFDPGTGSILPGAQPIELANIEEGKDYYAIVDLKFETAGYNYKLEGDTFCAFSTRDNREIVVITLQNSGEVYDGNSHPAVVSATTTTGQQLIISQDIDFRYTYYLAGDPQYENGSDVAPVNAGTYKLVLEIKPNYNEDYRPYDSCEFNYVIDQAEPVLKPTLVNPSAKLYAGADLPEIVADVPAGGTPGTYTWDAGQKLRSGIQQYSYTFAPDSNNYKTTTGMMELATIDAKIQSISATINLPEGVTIYDSFDLEDLKEYLTVSGVYNNGDTVPNIYGYTITGTLTEGDSTLTIHYGTGDDEKTCRVTINGVVASKLEEITADFSQDGNVFTSSNLEDLKAWLEVKGVYNDGKSHGAIPGTSYELSVEGSEENGEDVVLPEGVSNIIVTYWHEGKEYKTKFPVNVKPVVLESITALFEPGLNEIKGTTPLRKLKDWLTITGTNNDGSAYETEITSEDYTLSGKLIPDSTSTITVRYQGKSTTFEVYVIPSANGGNRTLLPLPEIASPMTYTGALLDVLAGWAHIDLVEYVGNQATEVGKYRLILTIKDFDSYEWDTSGLPQTEVALQDMEGASTSYTIEDDMLSVEWEIIPAVLKGTWNENGTLDLMVSSSFKGSLENVVTYKYYDKNGNEVTSLYEGETYTVEAILVDTKNFVMDDETTNLLSQPHEFTVPTTNKEPNKVMEFFKNIWNFIMLYWLWFLIGLIILLFLIFLIILLAKRRKKEEKEEEKPNEEPVKTTKEEIQVHMQQPMVQPMQGAILPTGATLAGLVTPNTNNEAEIAKIKAEKDAEIAKIKAEAEIAKAKAEMASQTQAQPVQQS
ncbi:MAG: hypothetical protein K2N64_03670, partial [Anaeroplasmataceae bacterium]|nr:hypothetical protein [Anaeroplasmataceae bacterium]